MEPSMDLQIRAFKNTIIDFMNKSPLATEVKRLVLSELLQETTRVVDNDIRAQIQSIQKEKENSDPENSPE